MIRLPDLDLSHEAAKALQALQAEIDAVGGYAERVAEGKRLFAARNRRGNGLFDEVKRTLDRMCSGARRCAYCEDSVADEVEHVRPKDLYPEVVFAWPNYVYACGPCNGPKGSHHAVFIGDGVAPTEVARRAEDPVVPPPDGTLVLIDPRTEDASQLMALDLRDTYYFIPLAAKGSRDHARADYTIKTLRLNARDALVRARRQAYFDYASHVRAYQHVRDRRVDPSVLVELREVIQYRQHPTVWREMQRMHRRLPALRELFEAVPEALTW